MKTLIQLFIISLFFNQAQATLIQADYSFDGTNLSLESGEEIRNTNFNVGDIITLTFSANGNNSYWDFSDINDRSFEGFDLVFSEYANRQMDGHFYFYYDGALVDSSYYYVWNDSYLGGPEVIDVKTLGFVDTFKIKYKFFSSTAASDFITTSSSDRSIWNTLGGGNDRVTFVNDQAISVSEPSSLALVFLSFIGLFFVKRKIK